MSFGFNFGAKPQNNAFTSNNSTSAFGQNNNTTQNTVTGFGTGNTGFGSNNNTGGFGTGTTGGFGTNSATGFGGNNTGFGSNNNTGFGNTNTGFSGGNSSFGNTNTGFGTGGFGTANNTGGFGTGNTTGGNTGFGMNNAGGNSPFGANNSGLTGNINQSFVHTEDYNKDVKMNDAIVLHDSISSIKWVNLINNDAPPIFAGTCWDKSVRIFEVSQNGTNYCINQKSMVNLPQPATCLAWNQDNTIIYLGCIDGVIRAMDVNTMNITEIGKHNVGISSINFVPGQNVLISTGFEDKVNFWQGNPNPVMSVSVENKIFVADYNNGVLAGATANERIFYLDLNTLPNKTITDSVDLGKFSQIQSLSLDKRGETIGLTTVDGRSNISSLTRTSSGFKSHAIITFKSNKT